MNVKWLAMIGLIAFPVIAHAECGWLLMMPTSLSQKVEPGGAIIGTPPLGSWVQLGAFDDAERCEGRRMALIEDSRKKVPDPSRASNEVKMGKYRNLTDDEQAYLRWSYARCLPASQVPVH